MGVISTGSIFKTLTFDGKSSSEFNVYITGEGVFNAPERAVEMISIPGRNGAFALDYGRFENIEVTYNCGIAGDSDTDFAEAVSAFRNWLCSRNGYVRLTDDYNAGEYRMAVYKSGLEVTAERLIAGEFPIVFECKPQRFLTSGEDKITVGEWGETTTETGDIVEIENPDGILSVKSLTADINAEQDLNGYSSPWIHDDNEQTPYIFRSSDTVAEVGNSIFDTLVGGTLAVNQFNSNNKETGTVSGVTFTNNGDGSWTLNGTASASGAKMVFDGEPQKIINHVYFVRGFVSGGSGSYLGQGGISIDTGNGGLWKNTQYTTNFNLRVDFASGNSWNNAKIYPQVTDLTQFVGSTIADYVYNLEQSTAGSGVAWLRQYYPSIFNSYQPYNAGTLESVEASAHVMTGFNQWDEVIEVGRINTSTGENQTSTERLRCKNYISVIPNTNYYLSCQSLIGGSTASIYVYLYDENQSFIGLVDGSNTTISIPQNGRYMRFMLGGAYGMPFKNDICVNISSSRNGEYEPYTQTSYPLDSDLVLRGIPKLNNGVPYYDGDEYKSDGSVNRRYTEVDFADFTFGNVTVGTSGSGVKYADVRLTGIKGNERAISNKYTWLLNSDTGVDKSFKTYSSAFTIYDNRFTDADTAKNILISEAVSIVYMPLTPTTETADPYTNPQVVYADGTEEYITNNVVSVGHVTDHANICPITGHDTVNVIVSPTTTGGTTYSTALGSTVYGGTLDIVSGELTLTRAMTDMGSLPWIASGDASNLFVASVAGKQNGNTNIMSDMYNVQAVAFTSMTHGGMRGYSTNNNVYCKNTDYSDAATFKTAMNGVQLVYELATPTTTTLTAQQVQLLLGENNIWADTGNVTVEFGQNPNILVNPTLFESRPMLEVYGVGKININSETIDISSSVIGDVTLVDSEEFNSDTGTITINGNVINTGDTISVSNTVFAPRCTVTTGLLTNKSIGTVTNGNANILNVSLKEFAIRIIASGATFTKGTSGSTTTTVEYSFDYSGSTRTHTATCVISYDGNETITYSISDSPTTPGVTFAATYILAQTISAYSTKYANGNPMYIDLDIGEAWNEDYGDPVSVNNSVTMPAELPTLTPGANTITFDNTITGLDIVPRWFKI